jgi:hypothetical protein
MTDDPFSPAALRDLDRVARADVVVGVVSFNSERTVRQVAEAAAAGLHALDARASGVIVVGDGGSRDRTVEAARRAETGGYPVVVAPRAAGALARLAVEGGLPGKGSGLRAVFAAAERLRAAACLVVDADVAGVSAVWVRRLLEPVLRGGLDLVAPVYQRHMYDSMLTSFLVYPLTRALYGRRLRQPVGGHFGCSAALVRRLLGGGMDRRHRLDLWTTTTALAEGLAVGQAYLGAGRRGARESGAELGGAFAEVVGTVYALMEEYRAAWWPVAETVDVPSFGEPPTVGAEPVSVNLDRMMATFRQGASDLMPVWRRVLPGETCDAVAAVAADPDAGGLPDALWARVVLDGAVAHHRRVVRREHLLRALVPLYLGRAAAYVLATSAGDACAAEADVEGLCGTFESMKPYLRDRWDTRRP